MGGCRWGVQTGGLWASAAASVSMPSEWPWTAFLKLHSAWPSRGGHRIVPFRIEYLYLSLHKYNEIDEDCLGLELRTGPLMRTMSP